MTAMSHAFKTEIENKSSGNPSFLSRHIDALCPPTQEEDEWLDQELERARLQRGTFYKKLANSRSASARELEDMSASKLRSASRGSTERELSLSPSGSTTSPPPAIPEPHSSWRFYTSFDNGEWKRHCVPVYKAEEDILMKSPTDSTANKENSPAYESHLRKYRQARASLFDRPPSSRRFTAVSSPREETTTVRIVSNGNDGITRHSGAGSSRLPFGRSAQDGNVKITEHIFDDRSGRASVPSAYRQEVTTSETITSVQGPDPSVQVKEKPQTPIVVAKDPSRPKHHNLGYKEKIIVPTKYKTDAEKEAASVVKIHDLRDSFDKKDTSAETLKRTNVDADKPSFLGSTFEKFSYSGVPLVTSTTVDLPPNKPIFGNSSSMNIPVKVENIQKPSFDSSFVLKPSFSSFQQLSSEHIKPAFQESNVGISTFGAPFGSSTPIKSSAAQSSTKFEKSSLPFDKPTKEHSIPVGFKHVEEIFKSMPEVPAIEVTGENVSFGNQFSAFSAPSSSKNRPVTSTEDSVHNHAASIAGSADIKKEGVIFIPVIRVLAPAKDSNAGQATVNLESSHSHSDVTDRLHGVPILELEEDKSAQVKPDHEIIPSNISVNNKVISPSSTKSYVHDSSGSTNGTPFQEKIITPSKAKSHSTRETNGSASGSPFQEKVIVPSSVKSSVSHDSEKTSGKASSNEKIIIPSSVKFESRIESSGPVSESEANKNVIFSSTIHSNDTTTGSDTNQRLQTEFGEKMPGKIEKPVFSKEGNFRSQFEVAPKRIPIEVELSPTRSETSRPSGNDEKNASSSFRSESKIVSSTSNTTPETSSQPFAFSSNISPKLQLWSSSSSSSPFKDQGHANNLSSASARDTTVDKEYSFDTDDWVVEKAVRF